MMLYLQLFYEFFKTGLFAVGGGLATLPFLYDMAARLPWFTTGDLTNMIAVSESTPGPMGVNMATYVGYITGGVPGSIIATLGLITPSIIVILIIASVLKAFRENRYVEFAFYGLRAASTALIASAGLSVVAGAMLHTEALSQGLPDALAGLFNWQAIALAAAVFLLSNKVKWTKKLHPIVFIALSAIVGAVFHFAGV